MVQSNRKYELEFSDIDFGCKELGWIPREVGEDPDDEDLAYKSFLKKKGIRANVVEGTVRLM